MIIPAKKDSDAINYNLPEAYSLDPPPSYTALRPESRQQTGAEPPAVQPAAVIPKACNYLSLSRMNNAIRGAYTIDPAMCVPHSLLPPLGRGETERDRKNLKLESSNGLIDVEVFLLGQRLGDRDKASRRTTIDVKSSNGSVTVKLNAATPRKPFQLFARTYNGAVTMYLPRSFSGLLTTTTTYGSTTLSNGLMEHATTFSEINSTRRCFVGNLSEWAEGQEVWTGDEVSLATSTGAVRVMYMDEIPPPVTRGFFSFVLGL